MWSVIRGLLLTTLLAVPLAAAQGPADDDIRSLDDRVQQVKADALDVAAELNLLEQRLLFPSGTRLTVSLAISGRQGLRLSAAELRIDGNLVAHHIYSESELEALGKGGVQTLYVGNVTTGTHELDVRLIGKLASGMDVEETGRHVFTKGAGAKTLDVRFERADPESRGIRVRER